MASSADGAISIESFYKHIQDSVNLADQVRESWRPSISTVPSVFRDLSPSSFKPRMVSIGPLHRNDPKLQKFEGQKATYIHRLLDSEGKSDVGKSDVRRQHRGETLKACFEKVSRSVPQIRECYAETTTYTDDELAKMMVIDGCFILDFIFQLSINDGPIWKNMLINQSIIYDLLLIENQIPFFVLKDIFECTILRFNNEASFADHINVLIRRISIFHVKDVTQNVSKDTIVDHILGLVHKSLQPAKAIPTRFKETLKGHSAMELDRAGLNFRPYEGKKWLMSMKLELPKFSCFSWFCCKPTLRMPVLCINDFTEVILRNLIIYEQSSEVPNCVSSYISAMDMLIDTLEDVAVLVKSQVLLNNLGSNEMAANMINNICSELPVVHFFYEEQWKRMDKYYNRYWPNTIAGLKRVYFNNPWNIIALFAAFVLFALTVVQTIFTIKAA